MASPTTISEGAPQSKLVNPERHIRYPEYLLELQREPDPKKSSCDVHLICDDGYIPVHRLILLDMAHLCPHLPPSRNNVLMDALREATNNNNSSPGESGIVRISLAGGVKLDHLRAVVSLIYGGEALLPEEDKKEVEAVIKLLQLDFLCSKLAEGTRRETVVVAEERGRETGTGLSVRWVKFSDNNNNNNPVVAAAAVEPIPVGGGGAVEVVRVRRTRLARRHAKKVPAKKLANRRRTPRVRRGNTTPSFPRGGGKVEEIKPL